MKLKFILIMLVVSMISKSSFAQNINKALKIGDQVPDIRFELMNGQGNNRSLSDLKGKLVLIDFWSTNCTGCILQFPKLDSLQKEFGERLKIILVSPKNEINTEQRISKIFQINKSREGKEFQLERAINDVIAHSLFKPKSIPHYAWIDPKGILIATTGSDEVTKNHIKKILKGETLDMQQKVDTLNIANIQLFSPKNNASIKYKSMLTEHLEGLPHSGELRASGYGVNVNRICYLNDDILTLIGRTDGGKAYWPSEVIVEGMDRSEIICPQKNAYTWSLTHTYCYELITSPTDEKSILSQARRELEEALQIRATLERRRVPCLVLKMDSLQFNKIKAKIKPGEDLSGYYSLADIADEFKKIDAQPIVIAETRFKEAIFPTLSNALNNLSAADLYQFVKDNGLTLTKELREHEVLVIKKAKQ